QVAVDRLRWMQIQRRCARRAERRGNFPGDNPALAHPRYHYAPAAGVQALDRALKVPRHGPRNALCQLAQRFRLNSHYIGACGFHSLIIVADRGGPRMNAKGRESKYELFCIRVDLRLNPDLRKSAAKKIRRRIPDTAFPHPLPSTMTMPRCVPARRLSFCR